MNDKLANISIPVDLTNPGQFFACCGLLELGDRVSPGSEGWFDRSEFRLSCESELRTLLACLVLDPPLQRAFICDDLPVKPIIAPLTISFDGDATERLLLDFWAKTSTKSGKVEAIAAAPWNLWSGNQKSHAIWLKLRDELRVLLAGDSISGTQPSSDNELANLFQQTRALTGRFGFDSTAAWNAQDVGFSPNDQDLAVESSPAIELLAAIGLQRFIPFVKNRVIRYQHWSLPAGPIIAAALACGGIEHNGSRYEFEIVKRGQYSAFSTAHPLNGENN
ncbi:MAG: hypothetical protein R3E01_06900 [Pirellulaceae bacterium]|nr:hypothetical protein [Planctomycetales bacterium]